MAHLQQAKEVAKLPVGSYYLTLNGRLVTDVPEYLRYVDPQSYLRVIPRILGGKGGFSSLLRSFRIYRSTNQEMCRDLTGRRLKDVKEEERLRKWVAAGAKREQEKKQKLEEKYARLKAGPGKHDFTDVEYEKAKQEMLEQNEEAFEQGMKEFLSSADVASSSGAVSSSSTAAGPSRKRSASAKTSNGKAKKQKADNWLGIEGLSDTDSDGESQQVPIEIPVVDLDGSHDENTDEISVVDLEPRGEQTEKSAQPDQSTAETEVHVVKVLQGSHRYTSPSFNPRFDGRYQGTSAFPYPPQYPPSSAYFAAVNRPFVSLPMYGYLPTAMHPMQQFPDEMGIGPPPSFMPPWSFVGAAVYTPSLYGYPNEMNTGAQHGQNNLRPSPPCPRHNQTPLLHGGSLMGEYVPLSRHYDVSKADGLANRTGMTMRPPTVRVRRRITIETECYQQGGVQSTDGNKYGRMNSDANSEPTVKEMWHSLIQNCTERGGDFDGFGWALSQQYRRKVKTIGPTKKKKKNAVEDDTK